MFRDILSNFKNWFYYLILHTITTTNFSCQLHYFGNKHISDLSFLKIIVISSPKPFKSLVIYRQFFCFILMLPWKPLLSVTGQSALSSTKKCFVRAPWKRSVLDNFESRHLMILYQWNILETIPLSWVRTFRTFARNKWVHKTANPRLGRVIINFASTK